MNVVQTAAAGGEAEPMRTPFPNTRILDLSPDQSEFLLGSFVASTEMPLWTMPVGGGSPRRVGEITAIDATWCPDGHRILYSQCTPKALPCTWSSATVARRASSSPPRDAGVDGVVA